MTCLDTPFLLLQLIFVDIDQLLKIMKLCGTPDDELMNRITSQEARNYIRTLPLMKKKSFRDEFKNANEHGNLSYYIIWLHFID